MGWISIKDKYPPEGLQVLLELSGQCIDEHGVMCVADHGFHIGSWIIPTGKDEGEWLIDTRYDLYEPTVHAWMPLPKHYEPQDIFEQEPDLMEHAMFEENPEWLYKGDCIYEQMSIEDLLCVN